MFCIPKTTLFFGFSPTSILSSMKNEILQNIPILKYFSLYLILHTIFHDKTNNEILISRCFSLFSFLFLIKNMIIKIINVNNLQRWYILLIYLLQIHFISLCIHDNRNKFSPHIKLKKSIYLIILK